MATSPSFLFSHSFQWFDSDVTSLTSDYIFQLELTFPSKQNKRFITTYNLADNSRTSVLYYLAYQMNYIEQNRNNESSRLPSYVEHTHKRQGQVTWSRKHRNYWLRMWCQYGFEPMTPPHFCNIKWKPPTSREINQQTAHNRNWNLKRAI